MAFNIIDRSLQATLERNLSEAQKDTSDSLERLSSGSVFTRNSPQPAERALAEGLEFKLRSLSSSKRNINTAVNLLQTAEASLSEVTNIVLRMKEINTAAANTTIGDRDRAFLFVEYQALHDEIDRIAKTTEFNGIPLLDGNNPKTPETLIFRVGDPQRDGGDDVNAIKFTGLRDIVATTAGLGLKSAAELLANASSDGGIAVSDAQDLLTPDDDNEAFPTAYDQALDKISAHRAALGGLQERLHRAVDFIDVYHENLTAAKSSIADVDYAKEASALVAARIRVQAGTAAMAQGNINAHQAMTLLNSVA